MNVGSELLVVGDARKATDLLPSVAGRVALSVTSPPYHNAISYDSHAQDPNANFRIRDHISYADEYLPLLDEVWHTCHEMLRPGGHLAINVGSVLSDGYHFPLAQDITARVLKNPDDWTFIRSIIWNKVTAGVKRAGSVIKYKLPGYWYPNILTEHIIVFKKPGPSSISKDASIPDEWWLPVWDLAPVPPRQVPHPAPFPEDLPHRLIRMLTEPGDIVYDPFLGAGATAKAAYDLGRIPAGTDLEPQYVEHSKVRIGAPSSVRTSQLVVEPQDPRTFVVGKSRGRTRHGSGLKAKH